MAKTLIGSILEFLLSFAIVPVPLTALLLCIFQNLHWITSTINLNFAMWQFKVPLFYSYGLVALISLVPALYLFLKILQEQELWGLKLNDLQSVLRQVEKERDNLKAQLMQVLDMTSKVPYSVSFDKCIRHQVMGEPVRWIDLPQNNVFPMASSMSVKPPSSIPVSQLPKAPMATSFPSVPLASNNPSPLNNVKAQSIPFTEMLSNFTDAVTDAIFALSAYVFYDLLKIKPRPLSAPSVSINNSSIAKGKAKVSAPAVVESASVPETSTSGLKRRDSSKSSRTSPVQQEPSISRASSPGNGSSGDDSSESRYPLRRRKSKT